MSRSGYTDDCDGDNWAHICWRGAVSSAIRGKRGQQFFTDLLAALDAMPNKRLIAESLEFDGDFCTLGVLGAAKNIDLTAIDPEEPQQVSKAFNIAEALAQEVFFMNDQALDFLPEIESPEKRWVRMRVWVANQIAT